jgi:hypothetical protein
MSTLEVNSLIHLDASSNNLDLDSSGNATVNGNMTATQFYGGGGNLTGVGVDGIVSTANATAITIDSSENVGIGVVPESHYTNKTSIQLGGNANMYAHTSQAAGGEFFVSHNAYQHSSGNEYYISTDEASQIKQSSGKHEFQVAESGTADSAISWTTALTITKEGKVGIGDSSPAANFNISNGTTGVRSLEVESSGSNNESVGVFKTSNSGFNDTILMAQNLNGTGGSLLKLQAGGSTVLEVKATGGILFNGDTSANNALDDYEEGTFTPVLSDGTNNASHNSQVGNYIRIGKSVQCRIYIAIGSLGSIPANYDLRITGLPFTSSTENSRGVCVFGNLPGGNLPTGTTPVGYVESYTTFMYLRCFDGARESTLRADEWSADGSAIINVMYQAQT